MQELGSDAHRALIGHVIAHYSRDERILAVAVFASVAAGTWHPLSDVDMDIVTGDEVVIAPGAEVAALFGTRAAIVIAEEDSADVVLDSLEELSIRWHPLAGTSPFITSSVRLQDRAQPVTGHAVLEDAHVGRPASRGDPAH